MLTNLKDKFSIRTVLAEPFEEEDCLEGEVEVDVLEVFKYDVIVLLGLGQQLFLEINKSLFKN